MPTMPNPRRGTSSRGKVRNTTGLAAQCFEGHRQWIVRQAGMKDPIHDQPLVPHPERGQYTGGPGRFQQCRTLGARDQGDRRDRWIAQRLQRRIELRLLHRQP